ncbi:MAG: antibiotic biosynthesis monooxygenase [Cyclobacteriaceae bacterium]|nr:antibiotic biosynthesis monooxygenase [Cyclobacteriaceae bacterium]
MIVTFVHVWVKEDRINDFIQATLSNHSKSVREAGNLRFDVLQDSNDPAKFVLYEAYESDAAAADHKDTPHYLHWKETVADWMLKPREGIKHRIIAPADKSAWK